MNKFQADAWECETIRHRENAKSFVVQLAERAKELEEAKTERDNWMQVSNRGYQKLVVSQQQVVALREALGWPEWLGTFCMYCGKTSSVIHCQDCLERMRQMPILAAHEFNAREALATPAPASETEDPHLCVCCGIRSCEPECTWQGGHYCVPCGDKEWREQEKEKRLG